MRLGDDVAEPTVETEVVRDPIPPEIKKRNQAFFTKGRRQTKRPVMEDL
jgi:hypothetical protein